MPANKKMNYGQAIREGHAYLLKNHKNVFVMGQGVWSPWYAGNSMLELEKEFGKERVIDTPVSEAATTGAAVGASLCGYRPIVLHPRIDFMILAMDSIVNQAAKWSHMLGGQAHPAVTFRAVVNRGGEQGAQHSQALHSWLAHIPGLRVVMPATVADARDLLIAATLSDDPVMYIDDRWLYEMEDELPPAGDIDLLSIKPKIMRSGSDVTIVASSYSTKLAVEAADILQQNGISAEIIDMRVINPIDHSVTINSVTNTGRLVAIDGGWSNCGLAAEMITGVCENIPPSCFRMPPLRITLPDCPAPTSGTLEKIYYTDARKIADKILKACVSESQFEAANC
ncbi:MAG: transketolase C-terminal domain-containing protein [Rickettsiales bacterium]